MSIRWISFRNDSGGEIPAFGIIKITGIVLVDQKPYLKAEKSDAYGAQYDHYVNGAVAVPSSAYGKCASGADGPVWAAYDDAETPAFGEHWGPINADWELKKKSGGFRIYGEPTDGRVLVLRAPLIRVRGELDGDLADASTATVSAYYWNGSAWTDSGENISSVRVGIPISEDIESGKVVWMDFQNDDWFVTAAEC
jgi:hypothetical protein